MDENYKKIVKKRYSTEAHEKKLSIKSTMPDLNTRRLEIQNLVKYLEDGENCLEVGCGNGAASIEISKIKNLNLLSIDENQEMINLAQQQSIEGVKGKIEFRNNDVLELNSTEEYDTVYSTRCIINLMLVEDQKKALENMAYAVKKNGKLLLLEAFSDGLSDLNDVREELGLEKIPPAYHNLHLEKEIVISHLEKKGMKLFTVDNFLSSYYFWSRGIYPSLVKANSLEPKKNSKIDSYFSYLPPIGNFSHIKILGFKKEN